MAVKNRLKVILAEKKILQNDMAKALNLSKTTLSNIINGYQNATLETALDIAKYLNTPVERIFYKEGETSDATESFKKMIEGFNELYEVYKKGLFAEDILRSLYQGQKDKFIEEFGIETYDFISDALIDDYRDNRIAFEILLLR
jgi:putative transcriptional regulator